MRRFTLALLILLGVGVMDAAGATYYVDDTNGLDSNDGLSWEEAWKTIPYVGSGTNSLPSTGSTVNVKNGAYVQYYDYHNTSGIHHNTDWTIYQAATGHVPTLAGITIRNGSSTSNHGESYLRFIGINGTDTYSFNFTSYIDINNCDVNVPVLETAGNEAPYIESESSCYYFKGSHYGTFQNCEGTNAYWGVYISGCDNVDVLHNFLHKCASDGIKWAGTSSNYLNIHGNRINELRSRRTHYKIPGTTVGTFIQDEICTQYTTEDVATGGTLVYDPAHGLSTGYIFLATSAADIMDTTHNGGRYYVKGNDSLAILTQSTGEVDGAHRDGIETHTAGSTHIDITDNIVSDCPPQGITIYSYGTQCTDVNIENNCVFMDVTGNKAFELQGVHINKFNNNTAPVGYSEMYVGKSSAHANFTIDQMHNNILWKLQLEGDAYGSTTQIANHGNNIFELYQTGGGTFPFGPNSTDVTGLDMDASSPKLFVNSATNDYNIPADSPAEDAGNALHSTTYAVDGVVRTAKPDIGAYEYTPQTTKNHRPVISTNSASARTIEPGESIVIVVSGFDADGDPLTYGVSGLPSGAVWSSPIFAWTPLETQSEVYTLTFTVDDGSLTNSTTVTITVSSTAPTSTKYFLGIK